MLSELPPKMSHLCTREIVSHLALLSSGSIEPSMQHVLKTKAPSKPVEKPLQGTLNDSKQLFKEELTNVLCDILLNEKIPSDVINKQTGKIIIPANRKITRTFVLKLADDYDHLETECGLIQGCIRNVIGLLKNAQKQLGSSD